MGRKRTIFITEFDLKRLNKLVQVLEDEPEGRDTRYLEQLDEELQRAKVVAPARIPRDVVTMNSRVRVRDLDSGAELITQLVFPGDSDVKQHKISVLAPIGTALIGYRVGDTVEWQVPAGIRRMKIEEILYQPEAEGDFHL